MDKLFVVNKKHNLVNFEEVSAYRTRKGAERVIKGFNSYFDDKEDDYEIVEYVRKEG